MSDGEKDRANDWTDTSSGFLAMKNKALSYFVGADSDESFSQMHVTGDRNVLGTDGQSCELAQINGVITTLPPTIADWQNKIHGNAGNMAMGDGSVQQLSVNGLRRHLQQTGLQDNRNCVLKP
jgi:prepilin-type processing-associated H-X9-DG protein